MDLHLPFTTACVRALPRWGPASQCQAKRPNTTAVRHLTCQAVSRGHRQAFGQSLLRPCSTDCTFNHHHPVPGWHPAGCDTSPGPGPTPLSLPPAPRPQAHLRRSAPHMLAPLPTPTTPVPLIPGSTKTPQQQKKRGQSGWLWTFLSFLTVAQMGHRFVFQSCSVFFPCVHSIWPPMTRLPRSTPIKKLIFSAEPLEPLQLSEPSFCLLTAFPHRWIECQSPGLPITKEQAESFLLFLASSVTSQLVFNKKGTELQENPAGKDWQHECLCRQHQSCKSLTPTGSWSCLSQNRELCAGRRTF